MKELKINELVSERTDDYLLAAMCFIEKANNFIEISKKSGLLTVAQINELNKAQVVLADNAARISDVMISIVNKEIDKLTEDKDKGGDVELWN